MKAGETWGYREPTEPPGTTLIPAIVVQLGPPRSNKVRARVEGGIYPDLEQWLPRQRFIVPWNEAEACVADEARLAVLVAGIDNELDPLTYDAIEMVFSAVAPSDEIHMGYRRGQEGVLFIEHFVTTADRLGLDVATLISRPNAFVDRFGTFHGDAVLAGELAPQLATRFRDAVLAHLSANERSYRHKAIHGTFHYSRSKYQSSYEIEPQVYQELLAEELPVYRLVREWCGADEQESWDETQALRAEVARLHGLIERAIELLRECGHPNHAKRLEKDFLGDQYEAREKERVAKCKAWRLPPR